MIRLLGAVLVAAASAWLGLSAAAELYGSRSVVTSPYGVREGYLLSVLEHRGIRV